MRSPREGEAVVTGWLGDMLERDPLDSPEAIDAFTWTPPRFLRRRAEHAAQRRRLRRLLLLGLFSLLVYGFVLADGGLVSILKRHHHIKDLQAELDALEERRQWLLDEVERRENDPSTIERLAREEFGMLFPGEKIYRILEVSEETAQRVEAQKLRQLQIAPAAPEEPNH